MKKDLLRLCNKCDTYAIAPKVVIEEAYIPYIPRNWNQILMLAENQNLSASNEEYVDKLRKLDSNDRMRRLGLFGNEIGVYPWDDGSLKLAIEAAFGVEAKETAVSNAVLWSQRKPDNPNKDAHPDSNLQRLSSDLWRDFLNILNPKLVICSGKIAYEVIRKAGWNEKKIKKLWLASQRVISPVSWVYDEDDLLRRYPEIKKVLNIHPELGKGNNRKNKVFFAYHAVSLHGGNMRNRSS